jgi:hypothetical protein
MGVACERGNLEAAIDCQEQMDEAMGDERLALNVDSRQFVSAMRVVY